MFVLTFNVDTDTYLAESKRERLERAEDLIEYAVRKITNSGNLEEAEYALLLCRNWIRRGLVVMPARTELFLIGAEQLLASEGLAAENERLRVNAGDLQQRVDYLNGEAIRLAAGLGRNA